MQTFMASDLKLSYSHGITFVGRLLLDIIGDEEGAFEVLRELAEDSWGVGELWSGESAFSGFCTHALEKKVEQLHPKLHSHLKSLNVKLSTYTERWMTSIFSCYGVVEVETILLIWDIFFFERWSVLFSAALAVLEVRVHESWNKGLGSEIRSLRLY